VAGLYSIGRNGEFAHILMEDVYWRTRAGRRDDADDALPRSGDAPPSRAVRDRVSAS